MTSAVFTVQVDGIEPRDWEALLPRFVDANIYQTWAWGATKSGDSLSHILVREGGDIVAAVQARIRRLPVLDCGIAHVRWGPLWKPRGRVRSLEALQVLVEAMQLEFAERRRLLLRVCPCEPDRPESEVLPLLERSGFRRIGGSSTTLYLPLDLPLDAIRQNMSQNWRKNLRISERNGLRVAAAADGQLFGLMDELTSELRARKPWIPPVDTNMYRRLQDQLPTWAKLKVMVCCFGDTPVAGLIGCALGDVGIELVAATGGRGLELRGSYLLRWMMCQYLRESGCRYYDLNGINRSRNPGGYQFKSGLSGKDGLEVIFPSALEYCRSPLSYTVVKLAEAARSAIKARV